MSKEEHFALHEKHPEAMKRLEKEAFLKLKEMTIFKKKEEEAPSIYGTRPMDENNQS